MKNNNFDNFVSRKMLFVLIFDWKLDIINVN